MTSTQRQAAPVWAYVYQIVPPQSLSRLHTIRTLLYEEHSAAQREARTWASRLVTEGQTTRILIVSDTPGLDRPVDRRLVAELHRLAAEFTISEPVALTD